MPSNDQPVAPVLSILPTGAGGICIEIECRFSNSLPGIVLVGLGNKAVDEARERVRSAFASSGITMPPKRITINLAPADMPKESTAFDLAIALAIMQTAGHISRTLDTDCAVIGELGLGGNVRAVRGIIGKLRAGKAAGLRVFYIPADNLAQALLVPGITVVAVPTLAALYGSLCGHDELARYETDSQPAISPQHPELLHGLHEVIGQAQAKRALCIAAAGGHNILLNGPPGTGKSMLAKCLPALLPPMSQEEMLEVTHIHSLASTQYEQLVTSRPFRAPHHSASHVALIGGGSPPRPGEISLAHHGVLFLDEMPEFQRQCIEALRQPLEERYVRIARAKDTVEYPARFILIATANPCPCGYYGTARACSCAPHRIHQYRQKLSGPLMDRIDLYVDVENVAHHQLLENPASDCGDYLAAVSSARDRQRDRYGSSGQLNSSMTNKQLRTISQLEPEGRHLLDQAAEQLRISVRSYMRILKVARTIADLADSPGIGVSHVSEALQFRPRQDSAPQ